MTLIVLDSLTGQQVIVSIAIRAAVLQPEPAIVIEHPRSRQGR